jgi:hypothetical protein
MLGYGRVLAETELGHDHRNATPGKERNAVVSLSRRQVVTAIPAAAFAAGLPRGSAIAQDGRDDARGIVDGCDYRRAERLE